MISERDLAELIVPNTINDSVTFHRLAQVSKRFNAVARRLLIKRMVIYPDSKYKEIWTEQPNGQKQGLARKWYLNTEHPSKPRGQLETEFTYLNDRRHGMCREWFLNGQLWGEYNYMNGLFHGLIRVWHPNGKLKYEMWYLNGKEVIEK